VATADGEEPAWRQSQLWLHDAAAASGAMKPDPTLCVVAAQVTWDIPLYLSGLLKGSEQNGATGTMLEQAGPAIADAYAILHDPVHAARFMAASDPADPVNKGEAAAAGLFRSGPGKCRRRHRAARGVLQGVAGRA
jgi:hypothetical protein